MTFADRRAAGAALAPLLKTYAGRRDVTVLGLPRGGVPVAYEVAQALAVPLDLVVVRKLGAPGNPELAVGAIASGGARYINDDVVAMVGAKPEEIERTEAEERSELERREQRYRGRRAPLEVKGRTIILVDDGIATGASMHAAARAMRVAGAGWIVVAVPVAPAGVAEQFRDVADEFVSVDSPLHFGAVGQFYDRFDQTGDEEVRDLLGRPHGSSA